MEPSEGNEGVREQTYLLPLSLRDWLPAGDLAWFVVDAVGQMNLEEFYRGLRRDGRGGRRFHRKSW